MSWTVIHHLFFLLQWILMVEMSWKQPRNKENSTHIRTRCANSNTRKLLIKYASIQTKRYLDRLLGISH